MVWSFANALKLSYWFSISTPPFRQVSFIVVIAVLTLCATAAIALRIMAQKKRANPPLARGLRRLSRPLFFLAILGFILIWFRQLGAAILSARALFAFTFIIALAWFIWILRGVLSTYKAEYARLQEERKYREYLPKKK